MKKFLSALVMSVMLLSASVCFAGPHDFTLVNSSASYICYLYVSPSSSSSWEDDILPECIAPGESVFVALSGFNPNEALFDIRVEDENGNGENYHQFNLLQVSNVTILGGGQATYY